MWVPVLLRAPLVALFSLPGLLIIPRLSHAAEWSAEPSIRVASEYDDNIHLTPQPHNSVHGITTAPNLDLGVSSYIWQLNAGAEYERKNYSGENGLDTNNRYFRLGSSYRTERSTWQLNGSLASASVLTSETVSTNQYTYGYFYYFPVVNSVLTHRMQEFININPSWQWSMDERKQLLLSYQYSDVSYVDGSSVGLTDSSNRSATIKFTNQVNPADQVFLSGSYSLFHAPQVAHVPAMDIFTFVSNAVYPMVLSSESRSTSYQVGIAHVFSESMHGNLSLGSRHTAAEQLNRTCPSPNFMYLPPTGTPLFYPAFGEPCLAPYVYQTVFSTQPSTTFNGSLEVQHESTNASIAVSRDFSSSSAGDQVQNDTLSFDIKRSISSRLTGDISGNISKYSSETGSVINANYRSNQIQPSLTWQWTEELSVNANYRYTDLKRSWESKSVSSNYVYFSLTYQWPRISFSR